MALDTTIQFRTTTSLKKRIQEQSKKEKKTMSSWISEVISNRLREIELEKENR